MSEKRYLTVTALTRYIKKKFDVDSHLQGLLLKGEISNYSKHSRGHMYFTLKDEHARIQATMFYNQNKHLQFTPEDGMKVLVRGDVTVYEPYGQYQIIIDEMQPDGIGNLYLAYEQLKKKLENEGLFAEEHKKAIPAYPKNIGVITSPTGAAIRDILITLKRRYPLARVFLFPAIVQGEHAAQSLITAINKANSQQLLDVLIVGRGGGSLEDLWPFNEESVARAIFSSAIPIISAVGHETDFTIADFVADLRAPTPTAAAELATPNINELFDKVSQLQIRLYQAFKKNIDEKKQQIDRLERSYAFRYPQKLAAQKEMQLDYLLDRLQRACSALVQQKKAHYEKAIHRLKREHPKEQLQRSYEKLKLLDQQLQRSSVKVMKDKENRLGQTVAKLNALNPLKVMERGYSLSYNEQEQLIKSIADVTRDETVTIRVKDGTIGCNVLFTKRGKIT